jgi:hypothetical protein
MYDYDRRPGRELVATNLVLGPGVVNEHQTLQLQRSTLKAKSHGDFGTGQV